MDWKSVVLNKRMELFIENGLSFRMRHEEESHNYKI